mgnify:CR=1 FL=1
MSEISSDELFVPIEEVAKRFCVSISTVRAWLRQGMIPKESYIKMGTTYRFNIPRVIASLTQLPKDEPITPEPEVEQAEDTVVEDAIPVQLELDFNNPDKDI